MNIVNVLEKQCHAQIPRNWFILKPLKVMCYPNTTCSGIKKTKTLAFTPKNLQKKLWNYFKGDFYERKKNSQLTNNNSQDTFLSSFWGKVAAFWTFDMCRYLKEPVSHHEDFQELVRNMQKGQQPYGWCYMRQQS